MTTAKRLSLKGRVVQGFLLGALFMAAVQAWSDQEVSNQDAAEFERQRGVLAVLNCKSFVPETENAFVHLGGGFFAFFNRRDGSVEEYSAPSAPHFDRIRFSLRELGYESRLVYRPKGSLALKSAEGRTLSFNMEVLDYVQVSGRQLPCYRLIAESNEVEFSKAILICSAVGTENPLLVGTLYLLSDSGERIVGYEVEIRGRNTVEAEDHLWKVVEAASHF